MAMATSLATVQLPNPAVSSKTSVHFLKKVTGLAISSIAYCRNLFDEADFIDKEFEGARIKVIKAVPKNPSAPLKDAHFLSKWIEGAFDALERKYLRALILEIKEGTPSRHLLESYTFRFMYKADETKCTFQGEQSGSNNSSKIHAETLSDVQQLLRFIFIMCSSEQKLPPNHTTSMRLEYYDDVTPAEYEPPGFKAYVGALPSFKGESKSFRFGHGISTPFHGMLVSTRHLVESMGPQSSGENTSPEKNSLETEQGLKEVLCLCGKTEASSCMMKCGVCNKYQHAACYGFAGGHDKSQDYQHTCRKCSGTNNTKNEEPNTCLYRRFLIECSKKNSVTLNDLMQQLHLDCEETILFMKQLLRDGVLLKSTQPLPTADKPHLAFNVDTRNLKNDVMPKYFGSQEWTDEEDNKENRPKRKASLTVDEVNKSQQKRSKLSSKK